MKALRNAVLALALAAGLAVAKSAEDYLHGAASLYIQGRLQEAGVEVEEGIRNFPNDARLKTLAGLLKSMKDQQKKDQGGGEGQGGEGSQRKQDQQDSSQGKGQGKQDRKSQGQDQKKDQNQGKQDKDEDKDKGKDGNKDQNKDQGGQENGPPPQAQPGKEGDTSGGKGAAPVPPGQMSKEEAERLLNSYQDDEKREQKNLQRRYRKQAEVEEDW